MKVALEIYNLQCCFRTPLVLLLLFLFQALLCEAVIPEIIFIAKLSQGLSFQWSFEAPFCSHSCYGYRISLLDLVLSPPSSFFLGFWIMVFCRPTPPPFLVLFEALVAVRAAHPEVYMIYHEINQEWNVIQAEVRLKNRVEIHVAF